MRGMRYLLLSVFVGACSGNHDPDVAAYHGFVREALALGCQAMVDCCASPIFADVNACVAGNAGSLFVPPVMEDSDIRSGVVIFDSGRAKACVTVLQAHTRCGDALDGSVVDAYFCLDAFRGTLGLGASCSQVAPTLSCVDGAICSQTTPGICVVRKAIPPRVGIGQACTSDTDCDTYNCPANVCVASRTISQFVCN